MNDVDWGEIAAQARGRVATAARGYRRTGLAVALGALVMLPFSVPIAISLAILGGLFYVAVIRPSAVGSPQVFIGRITGRKMWRKVFDPDEGGPGTGRRSEVAHFAKWMLVVRVGARVELRPAAQPSRSTAERDMDFAVTREMFTSLADGEAIGLVVTPANDLLGYVTPGSRPVWLDEPIDQSWRRGGYRVLDDPEAWPE